EDIDDERVVPAHRRVVDADIVIREPADGVALLVHVVFRHYLAIQAQDQPSHVIRLASAEPTENLVEDARTGGECVDHVRHQHGYVVAAPIIVRQLNQLLSNVVKISTKGAYG